MQGSPQSFTVDGLRMTASVTGSSNGKQPPLLLVHGWGGASGMWWRLVPLLVPYREVWSLDLPGYGGSDAPDAPYDPPFFARTIAGFIREAGLERPVIVGSSMGGLAVLRTPIDFPGLASALVLVSPAAICGFPHPVWLRAPYRWITRPLLRWFVLRPNGIRRPEDFLREDVLERGVRRCFHRDGPYVRELNDQTIEMVRARDPRPMARTMERSLLGVVDGHPGNRAIRNVDLPVLLLWGKHDRVVPVRHAPRLARRLPRATLEIHPEAGHLPTIEDPDWVADRVLGWIEGVSPAASTSCRSRGAPRP